MKTWSLFFFLITALSTEAYGNLCSSYQPLINGVCDKYGLGCDVSDAPCSTKDGCNTRVFQSSINPGGVISFCIDPDKDLNFLKVQTTVKDGCGTVRTEVKTKDGKTQYTSTSDPVIYDERPNSSTLKRPIIISITGRPRPEDFGTRFVPPDPPPGPGIDVCTPPTVIDPSTKPPECDKGQRPALNLPGVPDWLGLRNVSIGHGETQTWCVNLNRTTSKWTMSVIDRTGAWQCMYHTVDYIPPVGSGLKTISWKKETTNTTVTWRNWDGAALPQGTYKIRITASLGQPNCPMSYEVNAHP